MHDPQGQIYSLLLLGIAAAETAVGLSILVSAFQAKGTVDFKDYNSLRG